MGDRYGLACVEFFVCNVRESVCVEYVACNCMGSYELSLCD